MARKNNLPLLLYCALAAAAIMQLPTLTHAAQEACTGAPPAELLQDGAWQESCSGSTPVTATCHAACSHRGAATITCGPGGTWDVSSFRGQCKPAAARSTADGGVCSGAPPSILNGRFPDSCQGAQVGDECFAVCDSGYWALGEPASVCEPAADGAGEPQWSAPDPGMCARGAIKNGTAFIVSEDNNAVILCYIRNGRMHDCVASQADVGETAAFPLATPLGIAVLGDLVWISDREEGSNYARIRVCKWSGLQLLSCTMQLAEYYGAGQLAIDAGRDILFHVLNDQACVMACRGIRTLQEECVCTTAPGIDGGFPFGVAVGFGHLWVTSINGLVKCPLDDSVSGFDWSKCETLTLRDENGAEFMPSGLLIDATGAGKLYMADGLSRAMLCNIDLTGCVSSDGSGTFEGSAPGLTGLAVSGGYMFVPLLLPGAGASGPALSVCKTPGSASSCKLRAWTTDPPLEFSGSVSIVVVPPRRRGAPQSTAISTLSPTQVRSTSAGSLRGVGQLSGFGGAGRAAAQPPSAAAALSVAEAEQHVAVQSQAVAAQDTAAVQHSIKGKHTGRLQSVGRLGAVSLTFG